jgi:hypothetical protein
LSISISATDERRRWWRYAGKCKRSLSYLTFEKRAVALSRLCKAVAYDIS